MLNRFVTVSIFSSDPVHSQIPAYVLNHKTLNDYLEEIVKCEKGHKS